MSALTSSQLIDLLQKNKISTAKELNDIEKYSTENKLDFTDALVQKGVIDSDALTKLIADHYQLPAANLSKFVPYQQLEKHHMVVFARTKDLLKIATSQPPIDTEILQNITKKTTLKTEIYFSPQDQIDTALVNNRQDLQTTFEKLLEEGMKTTTNPDGSGDPPVEEIVNLLIESAYHEKASDIHIEPQEKNAIVRFRIDGLLNDVLTFPKILHERLVTRIKVMSSLRTDEHLSAQDGKIKFHLKDTYFDLRVSIIPIVDGEKIVMRLLVSNIGAFGLADLGMNQDGMDKLTLAFTKSYGMILSTDPTGTAEGEPITDCTTAYSTGYMVSKSADNNRLTVSATSEVNPSIPIQVTR